MHRMSMEAENSIAIFTSVHCEGKFLKVTIKLR